MSVTDVRQPRRVAFADPELEGMTLRAEARQSAPDKVRAPAHRKIIESPPDKPISPWTREELERIALRATTARKRTKRDSERKALRFPPLRRVYSRGRIDPTTGQRRGAKSYGGDVWRYVVTWGFRILNDMHTAGIAPPPAEELARLFGERIHERAVVWHPMDGRGPHAALSYDDADDLAEDAAEHVLRDWTPDWLDAQRERGRLGGQRSRRGPTWTPEDLDALVALMAADPSLTVAALAEGIDRPKRTTERMLADLRGGSERSA